MRNRCAAEAIGRVRMVHVATVPETLAFYEGPIALSTQAGFEVHAVSADSSRVPSVMARLTAQHHCVPLHRGVSVSKDLHAIVRLYWLFRGIRPQIVHAHTPKGG